MFIDNALVTVKAGNGGNGMVSFRRERYVEHGGPDGGDGGDGGSVIAVGDNNVDGLAAYRINKVLKANNGQSGDKGRRHGSNGEDIVISVPLGTEIWEDDNLIADITTAKDPVVIAKGGQGGFGNAHFTSSIRQAPRIAERGEKGQERRLRLELKLIADIGLVGLPNAGKSTFLSVISQARPKIADYPFTTLAPNLGVADIDEHSLLIADIPGIIEGAAEGKGLGMQFLRHVERTAVLLHLIDASTQADPIRAYDTIQAELGSYEVSLTGRDQIIALTKIDAIPEKDVDAMRKKLMKHSGKEVTAISSVARTGTAELLRQLFVRVQSARETLAATEPEPTETIPTLSLNDISPRWSVEKKGKEYVVHGEKIERFASRTDFGNSEGVYRLRDIMRKMGINHELERKGIQDGDVIRIKDNTLKY